MKKIIEKNKKNAEVRFRSLFIFRLDIYIYIMTTRKTKKRWLYVVTQNRIWWCHCVFIQLCVCEKDLQAFNLTNLVCIYINIRSLSFMCVCFCTRFSKCIVYVCFCYSMVGCVLILVVYVVYAQQQQKREREKPHWFISVNPRIFIYIYIV